MIDLSDDEKAMLAELDEAQLIEIPPRNSPHWTKSLAARTELLKSLVYKDLVNFLIPRNRHGYLFISRKAVGGRRF